MVGNVDIIIDPYAQHDRVLLVVVADDATVREPKLPTWAFSNVFGLREYRLSAHTC